MGVGGQTQQVDGTSLFRGKVCFSHQCLAASGSGCVPCTRGEYELVMKDRNATTLEKCRLCGTEAGLTWQTEGPRYQAWGTAVRRRRRSTPHCRR